MFAVIPSAVVLGPLAILAAVFPGAAAVLSVLLKQWRAFLTVAGVHSTLVAVAFWRPGWEPAVRLLLPATAAVGLVWSEVRFRRLSVRDPHATSPLTRSGVHRLLSVTLLIATAAVIVAATLGTDGLFSLPGFPLVALTAGLMAAAGYAVYRHSLPPSPVRLSEEFVALLVILLVSFLPFSREHRTHPIDPVNPVEGGDTVEGPRLETARVLFRSADMDEVMSSPVVNGNRVYFGTGKVTAFGSGGAVYAAHAETGEVVWKFDHGGMLRPAYATPAVADGFVYCGEGLHSDEGCSLFALNSETGNRVWSLTTKSHTEGTPAVVGNRVYFCAGDDGIYYVEAGKVVWHRDGEKHRLHVDSPPVVANGRVYAGSGYRTWAVFALDAKAGDEVWRVPENLRAFGTPLLLGSRVAFGLGTGNLTDDRTREPEVGEPEEKSPAGAVVCVDGVTGKVAWRTTLPRSVHTAMTADAYRIYAGCRDGCVYALDRQTGLVKWRRPVGTALVAGPVLVSAFGGGASLALYTVTEEGLAVCLDPRTGGIVWTKDLSQLAGGRVHVLSSPAVQPIGADGIRRAIFVGGSVLNRSSGRPEAVLFRLEDAVKDW